MLRPDFLRALAPKSLTARVALGVAFLLIFGGMLVAIAAFAYGREAARTAYDRLLLGAANDIAASITVQNGKPELELPVSAFDLLGFSKDDRIGYRVIGTDGATLTGYDGISLPDGRKAVQNGFFDGVFFGEAARFAVVSRRFAERRLNGTVQVIVGQTLLARDAMAYDITRKALYVLAASGLAMALLAGLVVRSVLQPLEKITRRLTGRDPHDLTPMDTDVPRETAVLISALNGFMARLDRQMMSMRHLISDTAHQLRTPVAALRAQAGLLAEETDPVRKEKIAGRLQTRSVSLGRLLDQMLSQALVIHRGDSARREEVDLRDIALDVTDQDDHGVLYPEMDVGLEIGEAPVLVTADAPSLEEALKNLLANALKHGRSPVRVGAGHVEGHAQLWVQDAGPGPAPEIVSGLGNRFNRKGPARSSGSGLGLAIAHAAADSFGAHLVLEPGRDDGFRAALVFGQSSVLAPERGRS